MDNLTDIIYVACILPPEKEKKMIETNPQGVSIQAYKYHRLLAEGLARNGVKVTVISYQKFMRAINIQDGDHEIINGVEYNYVVPNKEGRLAYIELFHKIYQIVNKKNRKKNVTVLCDVLNLTISYAAYFAAIRHGTEIVGIITDFPAMSKKGINSKLTWKLIDDCDKWILLTEQMYEYLGKKKPAVIMEGHADESMANVDNLISNKDNPMRCIYAGGLKIMHGIERLVEAFLLANVENAELHIYGKGEYVSTLKELKSEKIIYHGVVPNDIVVQDELRATLLINPRPTTEVFTKYSFPSKNMEYMASGTPLLTTKLAGMPLEYYDYVYLFDEETVNGMANTLRSILSKSATELHQKGITAKRFVLENKSNIIQAKKVIQLLNI